MKFSRLRLRLTAGFAVALFVGFAALNGGLYWQVTFINRHEFRERLKEAAASTRNVIRKDGARIVVDSGTFSVVQEALIDWTPSKSRVAFVVYNAQGARIAQGGNPEMLARIPPSDSLPDVGDIDALPLPDGFHLNVAADTVLGTRVVAAATTDVLRARQKRFLLRELQFLPGALLLALVIGYSLSRMALEPIGTLARASDAISPVELEGRLPVGSPPDELDALATRFNALLDRIQALQEQSDAFLREVAHQIRTPLTLVLGEAELSLERDRSPEEYVRTLKRVQAAASQMTHRVRDLLLLARMEAGERPPLRDAVELDALALEATDLFRARAQGLGQHLELRDIEPCEVAGDEALLREALLEMLENACRHGRPGHPVAVSVRRAGPSIRLEVRNSGEPLPPVSSNGDSPSGRERARGLGLSIMRWIASVHGGQLVVERDGAENVVALVLPGDRSSQPPLASSRANSQ